MRARGLEGRRAQPPTWARDLCRDMRWAVYVRCAVRLARDPARVAGVGRALIGRPRGAPLPDPRACPHGVT
eukprot:4873731-Lingulodinium_polyedra.AAC.1